MLSDNAKTNLDGVFISESQEAVIETLETQSTALKDDEKFQEVIETVRSMQTCESPLINANLIAVCATDVTPFPFPWQITDRSKRHDVDRGEGTFEAASAR